MSQYLLSVVCDDSRETKAELIRALDRRPRRASGQSSDVPEGCARYGWAFVALEDAQRARADLQEVFGKDPRDRRARELHGRRGAWARAEIVDAVSGEQIFDACLVDEQAPPRGYRLEVRSNVSGHPLEAWLYAVGRVPEMTTGRYSWGFATLEDAREAEQRARCALQEVPAHLRGVARACVISVQAPR